MKIKPGRVAIHIVCCLLFLTLPYLLAPGHQNSWDVMLNLFTLREFIAYLLLIVFFYLNYLVLIPRLYFKHQYIRFFAIALVSYAVIALLPGIFILQGVYLSHTPSAPPDFHHGSGDHGGGMFSLFGIFHNLAMFLVVLFIALTLKINGRLRQTEKEKVTAELAYLKAQINPHFLFNTLNSIYSLAIENSDYTATAIVKLSGMMRYILDEAGSDFVLLDSEVHYISDYIELQRVRFGDTFKLEYAVKGQAAGSKIAPLILLPFVENAFKHGVNPEEASEIFISIDMQDTALTLWVKNRKVYAGYDSPTGGLGIENTRHRLQLLYPAKHKLDIANNDHYFTVTLTIQLT